jgi:hypothetical protein
MERDVPVLNLYIALFTVLVDYLTAGQPKCKV